MAPSAASGASGLAIRGVRGGRVVPGALVAGRLPKMLLAVVTVEICERVEVGAADDTVMLVRVSHSILQRGSADEAACPVPERLSSLISEWPSGGTRSAITCAGNGRYLAAH